VIKVPEKFSLGVAAPSGQQRRNLMDGLPEIVDLFPRDRIVQGPVSRCVRAHEHDIEGRFQKLRPGDTSFSDADAPTVAAWLDRLREATGPNTVIRVRIDGAGLHSRDANDRREKSAPSDQG
jgi:hypothetical protein